ncbi:copper amine oxidase domain-containing protein [Thermincola ferriacetica]|uniref:Copper amine oxidase domain-containing protein n=1 Tax=Thermincola ferriacetica TaxID=281456 RepID=A0A0L6VZ96_9FIRM|nr:copper amine oxidase domain-containing protein [Thermincola ferriacetica]
MVDIDIYPKDNPVKAEINIGIDTTIELESQFKEAETILASKFGSSKAKEIVDYARLKKTRDDEVPVKYWIVNNQTIRVISPGGYWSVNITVWQPGVKI